MWQIKIGHSRCSLLVDYKSLRCLTKVFRTVNVHSVHWTSSIQCPLSSVNQRKLDDKHNLSYFPFNFADFLYFLSDLQFLWYVVYFRCCVFYDDRCKWLSYLTRKIELMDVRETLSVTHHGAARSNRSLSVQVLAFLRFTVVEIVYGLFLVRTPWFSGVSSTYLTNCVICVWRMLTQFPLDLREGFLNQLDFAFW